MSALRRDLVDRIDHLDARDSMVRKVISTSSSMMIIVIIVRDRMIENPALRLAFADVVAFTLLKRPEARPTFFAATGGRHGSRGRLLGICGHPFFYSAYLDDAFLPWRGHEEEERANIVEL